MKNVPPPSGQRTRNFDLLRKRYLAARKNAPPSKQFQRWEHFWSQRLNVRGDLPSSRRMLLNWQRHSRQQLKPPPIFQWEPVGPTQLPEDTQRRPTANPGLGRINCIAFAPGVIYAGAATGGLWKSTDEGASWTSVEVNLLLLGVSDIAIDPQNSSTVYLGTGDRDQSDGPGFGVMKSTDGGASFTQLEVDGNSADDSLLISRLLIDPQDPANVLAAAKFSGIYLSEDAGETWTLRANAFDFGLIYDLQFKPGDSSVVYAAVAPFVGPYNPVLVSRDGGKTWTAVSGLPNTDISRVAIGVTPAAPNVVYALFAKREGTFDTFGGLYRSNDSGATWTSRSAEPNILGRMDGGDKEGQGEYDLALAVSPTKSDELFVGGINIWKSTDGGKKWARKSFWNRGVLRDLYVHADQHALAYFPGRPQEIWACNDGGIFRSKDGGKNWIDRSNGLQVTEFYTVAASPKANYALMGAQDNGVVVYDGAKFYQIHGADGFDCIFSHEEAETIFYAIYDGHGYRSTNLGRTENRVTGDINRSERLTPDDHTFGGVFAMDPVDAKVLYFGLRNLFKSDNNGSHWKLLDKLEAGAGELIVAVRVAPTDPRRIYVARGAKLFTSVDKGANWSPITLPDGTSIIQDVAVHPVNPNQIWVAFGGLGANRVWRSFNAGATWENISGPVPPAAGSLPSFIISAIVSQAGLANLVYVGTDVGVFLTHDGLSPNWIPFNANLPTVVVKDLEIHPFTKKLMAATFGRGLWQAPLFIAPEFSVFPSPNEIRLPRATFRDVAIVIPRGPGFSDSILLSIPALPTGISAAPVSTVANSASLRVNVAPTVALGTYDLVVQGTSGGIKASGALKVGVKAFTLSLSASVVTLKGDDNAHKSADITVTINRSPGFTDSVQLSLEGVPTGAPAGTGLTATITAGTTGNAGVLHLSVGRLAPEGGFVLTVRGVSGNLNESVQFSVDVLPSDVSSVPGPVQP
jgi:photosystem II stability/assembly factor-like uncharacterized protein